jgi:hypothetical protein
LGFVSKAVRSNAPATLRIAATGAPAALRQTIDAVAFLAPKIVEMIAAGRQPSELTAEALAERIDLPSPLDRARKAVGV